MRFFIDCDEIWQQIPDYAELVTHFKPNGLRANLTVLRWLLDTNQIIVDEALKDDLAELERIQALLKNLKSPCLALQAIIRNCNGDVMRGKLHLNQCD